MAVVDRPRRADGSVSRRTPRAVALPAAAVSLLFAYVVLVGGTPAGEQGVFARAIGAVVGGGLIAYYATRLGSHNDLLDRAILVSVVLFGVVALCAQSQRESLRALLTAFAYAAALYTARRVLLDTRVLATLLSTMRLLGLILGISFLALWASFAVQFASATQFRFLPPLSLALPTLWWGNRHDITLLLLMLTPAFFFPIGWYRARVLKLLALGSIAGVTLLDGSRNNVAAVVVASILGGAILRHGALWSAVRNKRGLLLVVAGILFAVCAGFVLRNELTGRLLNTNTLGARGDLWTASLNAWAQRPITGWGGGFFPFALQQTSYFGANLFAPRHPDSELMQLLAEGGLVGVAAAASVAVGAVVGMLRGPARLPAIWGVLVFGIAGFGANPSDFAFLIATALVWLAIAAPPARVAFRTRPTPRPARAAGGVLLVVVAATWLSVQMASVAWSYARDEVSRGDLAAALRAVKVATSLDPSKAIYVRERGILLFELGDAAASERYLLHAARLNPADPITFRALALQATESGNVPAATHFAARAVELQSSSLPDLVVYSYVLQKAGNRDQAANAIGQAVQIAPWILGVSNWADFSPDVSAVQALNRALELWSTGSFAIESDRVSSLWLAYLGDRPDLADSVVTADPALRTEAVALQFALNCDGKAAKKVLDSAMASSLDQADYWAIRMLADSLTHAPTEPDAQAYRLLTGRGVRQGTASIALSAYADGSTYQARDEWGYRRHSLDIASSAMTIPSASAFTDWLLAPGKTAATLDPTLPLARCSQ